MTRKIRDCLRMLGVLLSCVSIGAAGKEYAPAQGGFREALRAIATNGCSGIDPRTSITSTLWLQSAPLEILTNATGWKQARPGDSFQMHSTNGTSFDPRIGLERWINDDVDGAFQVFDKLVAANPDDAFARYARGHLAILKRHWKLGVDDLDLSLSFLQQNTIVVSERAFGALFLARGHAHRQMGNMETAVTDLRQAVQVLPQEATAVNELGIALDEQGQFEEAAHSFSRALELCPTNAWYYFNRGAVFSKLGRTAEALDDFSTAIRIEPDNFAAYACRGTVFLSQESYEAAVADLTRAIRGESTDGYLFLDRGIAYINLDAWTNALNDLDQAYRLGVRTVSLFDNRGFARCEAGNFREAIADYSEAISLSPHDGFLRLRRAFAYKKIGEPQNAAKDLRKAASLLDGNAMIHNELAWFLATHPDALVRDGEAALAAATKACEWSNWQNPSYLDTLAAAYAECGDFENAVKWQRKAIDAGLAGQELVDGRSRLRQYESRQPIREAIQ